MIIWNEKFSTGDPSIDKQHKMLFEFFNTLEDVIKEGRGQSYLVSGLPFLESYAKAHFGFEEVPLFHHIAASP